MAYEDKNAYPVKINLKSEESGSNLINSLEKAAADLNLYTERSYPLSSMYCNNCPKTGDCVNISFSSRISKLLHLYVEQFFIIINKNENYSSLIVRDEPFASLKKVKLLSGKLESRMEELLK
jgi:hypothetical protein